MTGIRAAQRERTREHLLAVARDLFAERGFADVGLAELVRTAGVTKGALYHHFADGKTALFAAVVARTGADVGTAVAQAADDAAARSTGEPPAWAALRAGCRAFLDRSTAPGVARVLLLDGPVVLGPQRWRELDDATSGRHLIEGLGTLVADGVIAPRPVEPLARLLSGAMNEAAVWLAGNDTGVDPEALNATWRELDGLLASLRDA